AEATEVVRSVSQTKAPVFAPTDVAASARRSSPLAVSPLTIPAADARVTAPAKMKFHVVFIAASLQRESEAIYPGENDAIGTAVFVSWKQSGNGRSQGPFLIGCVH